jgi:hypothetical protein
MSTRTRADSPDAGEELYRAAAADSLKELADTASRAIDAYLRDCPWYYRTEQQQGHSLALHVAYVALRAARKELAATHAAFGQTPGDTP